MNTTGALGGALLLGGLLPACRERAARVSTPVYAHLWVYSSAYPPNWDCTPILGQVFDDFEYAGIEGVELMGTMLRNPEIVAVCNDLIQKHGIPVVGASYRGDMWRAEERARILDEVAFALGKLREMGGFMLGLTVGDAKRMKTEEELDAQAETLRAALRLCEDSGVQPNIHNHAFEVKNDLHDLKGTMARVPELKLGPDLSWLARAGIDPAAFIREHGDRMVYMHIRDNMADNTFAEAVGDGVLDFEAIAQALKELGYQGAAGIELAYDAPPTRETRENWKLSRDRVREVFGW